MRDTPVGPARLGELLGRRRCRRRCRRRRRRRHLDMLGCSDTDISGARIQIFFYLYIVFS